MRHFISRAKRINYNAPVVQLIIVLRIVLHVLFDENSLTQRATTIGHGSDPFLSIVHFLQSISQTLPPLSRTYRTQRR
jgi:hypothetical protein